MSVMSAIRGDRKPYDPYISESTRPGCFCFPTGNEDTRRRPPEAESRKDDDASAPIRGLNGF